MKNSERTEKKLKNLKPFQKGKSGNPNGRPKKLPELDELLKDILLDETNGKTQIELIVRTLVKQSLKGDIRASEILLNRSYGKVKESIELEDNKNPYGFHPSILAAAIILNERNQKELTKEELGIELKESGINPKALFDR